MEMPTATTMTTESFMNDDVKAYLDSLTPAKSGPEWDCECRECGEEINDQCQGYCDPRRGHKCICDACHEEEEIGEEEEETEEEVFDRKYPKASCHRCTTPVTGATVVLCGGAGGACETWYCGDCHEDGTADCGVCK